MNKGGRNITSKVSKHYDTSMLHRDVRASGRPGPEYRAVIEPRRALDRILVGSFVKARSTERRVQVACLELSVGVGRVVASSLPLN